MVESKKRSQKGIAKEVLVLSVVALNFLSSAKSFASVQSLGWASASSQSLAGFFGWNSSENNLSKVFNKAVRSLSRVVRQDYSPVVAIEANGTSSIQFEQNYKGVAVFGERARVHFDQTGNVYEVESSDIETNLEIRPALTLENLDRVLNDYFQTKIEYDGTPSLKILKDEQGVPRLTYNVKTITTDAMLALQVFVDAHSGAVLLEFPRAHSALGTEVELQESSKKGKRVVYSALTDDAQRSRSRINFSSYDKVADNETIYKNSRGMDRSGLNAYRNSGVVYNYFNARFQRQSYDGKNSPVTSIVHYGYRLDNAYWFDEKSVMAYGDGSGEVFNDLTYALDVAGHEMTHGITSTTADLVYSGESGALNESFSDFFGKMIDYSEGNWYVGEKIVAKAFNRKALRNMENPEEFKQPNSTDSKFFKRIDKNQKCNRSNDNCFVHLNSGVPNRAAVLIFQSLGKSKTEQLYFNVLTKRLGQKSDFKDMRVQTEKECALLYGEGSEDCKAVIMAFDTVKM